MLRLALMYRGIFLSDKQFNDVLQITTDDLKVHNKHLKLDEILDIAVISARVVKRCA